MRLGEPPTTRTRSLRVLDGESGRTTARRIGVLWLGVSALANSSSSARDTLATVIVIYPDTNALFADYLMRRETSRQFLDLLSRGSVVVWLSPVVVAEAQRQTRESAVKLSREVKGALDNARRSFPLDEAASAGLLDAVTSELHAHAGEALKPLLDHPACTVIRWSEVSAEELVQRELDRRKPTLVNNGQSIGLRDTVIWHGLLETAARLDSDDYLVFVSNDKAFIEDEQLHESLRDEIDSLDRIPADNVKIATSLGAASLELRRLAKLVTEREEALVDALMDWVYGLDSFDWDGHPTSNEAVVGSTLPEGMKDVEVVVVPMLNVFEIGDENPARCVATNDLIFRARMSAISFVEATDDRLTMLGNAASKDDIAVEFRVTADVEAEIEYAPEGQYARVLSATVSWDV